MEKKDFFLTNNKSGWKTREKILKTNEPMLYNELKKFIINNNLNDLPFKQQVWHFMNNEPNKKKCICGNDVSFRNSLTKGYHEFCSLSCANTNGLLEKRVSFTIEKKYGVKFFPQHKSFIEKVKNTKLKKYGDKNYNNISKALTTKEKTYGDKNYTNKNKGAITTRINLLSRLSAMTTDNIIKYDLTDTNITLSCSVCTKVYEIYCGLFKYRVKANIKPCTFCNPIKDTNSLQEKELLLFIKENLPNEIILEKEKKIITPFELDIYIPSHKIAIEFNGLKWHSEEHVDKNYHLNKTIMCEKQDIQLIHIFEDEWKYKRDIVKSRLKNILGLTTNKIYARKCIIKEVTTDKAKEFLNENHIQGYVLSRNKIGLYYNNELVSLMCFTKRGNSFELVRFCNKLNISVIGGASKLLNYFIKTYNPKEIISFSDKRWSQGNLYLKLGFNYMYNTKPSYSYIIRDKRFHKFNFRKNKLKNNGFDIANKTEHQIMLERKIYRIYDCGLKKWSLRL